MQEVLSITVPKISLLQRCLQGAAQDSPMTSKGVLDFQIQKQPGVRLQSIASHKTWWEQNAGRKSCQIVPDSALAHGQTTGHSALPWWPAAAVM